eukprot:g2881.t1
MARAPTADEEREMNLKRKKEEMEVVNDVEDDDDEDDVDDDDDESTSLAEKEETVPETDEADTTSAKDARSILLQEDIARMRDLPERYKSNSIKEKACASYVADFRRRFAELYPARRSLFVEAKNECGVKKLLMTYLKSLLVNYHELYDIRSIATFVADHVEFERPTSPESLPLTVQSPTFTMECQKGDAFDMSTLLCSILLGAGYDAYCVFGTAPRWMSECDMKREPCPAQYVNSFDNSNEKEEEGKSTETDANFSAYKSAMRFDFQSKFQLSLERKKRARLEEEKRLEAKMMEEIFPVEPKDPLLGRRVHCWVLVKTSKRHRGETVFIEPTTGSLFPVSKSPYTSVESVWNRTNFWICMQQGDKIDFDFARDDEQARGGSNNEKEHPRAWHHMFSSEREHGASSPTKVTKQNAAAGSSSDELMDLISDDEEKKTGDEIEGITKTATASSAPGHGVLPISWVGQLTFRPNKLRTDMFGVGKTKSVRLYRKAKVERFAEFSHPLGVVCRTTKFEDALRTVPVEVHETYKHRPDKLIQRTRFPLRGFERETYDPGHPFAVKELAQQMGEWIRIKFYDSARMDSLVERHEIFGVKMTETFNGRRDDRLTYRSVSLKTDDGSADMKTTGSESDRRGASHRALFTLPGGVRGETRIRKMAEKYDPLPEREISDCVQKRIYYILPTTETDGLSTIVERFHLAKGSIIAKMWSYPKTEEANMNNEKITGGEREGRTVRSSALSLSSPKSRGADERDGTSKEARELRRLKATRRALVLRYEKDCYHAVRDARRETEEILSRRSESAKSIRLDKSVFETVREREGDLKRSDVDAEGAEKTSEGPTGSRANADYLTPYIPEGKMAHEMTPEEAQRANDACLKALKERLVERAGIIQRRLDKENDALAKRQAAFQRSRDAADGTDEEYEKFCVDAMFRIQILEQRLQKHDDTAMLKYENLIRKLQEDPRLAAATSRAVPSKR